MPIKPIVETKIVQRPDGNIALETIVGAQELLDRGMLNAVKNAVLEAIVTAFKADKLNDVLSQMDLKEFAQDAVSQVDVSLVTDRLSQMVADKMFEQSGDEILSRVNMQAAAVACIPYLAVRLADTLAYPPKR